VEDAGVVYENEPKAKQKDAVAFLNTQLFTTPTWLIDNDIYDRIGGSPLTTIGNIQDNVLNSLFGATLLNKLIQAEAKDGVKAYTITELFSDLKKGIWSELPAHKTIDVYRRNLQKSYISVLDNLLNPPSSGTALSIPGLIITSSSNTDKSDIKSVVRAHLVALKTEVSAAAASTADPMSKYHLQDIVKRIDNALNPKN
jgi:hypothetical protein